MNPLRAAPAVLLFLLGTVAAEQKIDFNRDIRPILSGKCFACHGPDEEERAAGLRLDTEEGARADLGDYAAVVPGDPEASELIYRVTTDEKDDLMPPPDKGAPLTGREVDLLRRWIEAGGRYARHWSYEKPERPPVPGQARPGWRVINPVDSFIQEKLVELDFSPSPEADRLTLARRVALDLTGLPPTWEEARKFVDDRRPDAYERFVKDLLARPAFGERWAQVWLDLARYADSAGYADDPPRTIWAYRDWVIRAFNGNLPFDRFTIEQIAGDLLENPGDDQLIATAFHRNTLTNNEGGTNDEEFRNVAIVDRVNTTMEVWMGTTMACAQCHTHKYDPITQHEYFRMFDFFNQSQDADKKNESPVLEVWGEDRLSKKMEWEREIEKLKRTLSKETPALRKERDAWLARLADEPGWNPLELHEARGADLKEVDGWIRLQGERPGNASYSLVFPTKEGQTISGIQLQVSPDQKENFVLSRLSGTWVPRGSASLPGRYVRVELPGKGKFLHLAEVEVFSAGRNIAPQGKATQISTGFGGPAHLANDGNTDGDYAKKSVSHTGQEENPWWELDLGSTHPLDRVKVWNRTDGSTASRIEGYVVRILDEKRNVVWENTPEEIPDPGAEFAVSGARPLHLTAAFASHEQKGFPAGSVLAAKIDGKKGWAIAGATGKANQLTLPLVSPMKLKDGFLRLTLDQRSDYENHVLTSFRIATTTSADLTDWAGMPADVRDLVKKDSRNGDEEKKIAAYHRTIAKTLDPVRRELAGLEKQLEDLKPETTVPVMRDLPSEQKRTTRVQIRGNYQNRGDEVQAGVPAAFHPLEEGLPSNRLALARWLVDGENPLTARVIVNRFWERIFGTGLVQTSEEFGSQGDLPTHPELLDWLAVEFRESGWDVKGLLEVLVTSATYRQQTATTPEMLEKDPFNRFYARGPRFRISAEMVRDQALYVSGLLSDRMYGPPVKPPQPSLGLRAAFGGSTDWKTSEGEDRYRRGIYTTWRRSSPYPSMATFDAPNREVCISRRGRTNTPLQALVTLNDPVYVEAAQALARRILTHGGATPGERLDFAWRTVLIREPRPDEATRMGELIEKARERFASAPEEAAKMATDPIGPVPEGMEAAELAAWTVAGNVLLNLDELFLKR